MECEEISEESAVKKTLDKLLTVLDEVDYCYLNEVAYKSYLIKT